MRVIAVNVSCGQKVEEWGGGTFIVPLQNITPTGRDVICLTSEMPKLRKYDDECAANRASDACLIIVLRRKYPDTKPNR